MPAPVAIMKIGSVRSHLRVGFGFGSSRSARRSSSGPAFGPGAAIIVRRLAMLGRADCRASATRRVNTREKTIAVFEGVYLVFLSGWWFGLGRGEVAEEKSVQTRQTIPGPFDVTAPPTVECTTLLFWLSDFEKWLRSDCVRRFDTLRNRRVSERSWMKSNKNGLSSSCRGRMMLATPSTVYIYLFSFLFIIEDQC